MHGTGGCRKLRCEDRRRGSGKRGPRRISHHPAAHRRIGLSAFCDKDEAADLTPDAKKVLKEAIQ
jgi:hypothetical protein